jgi:hypothetical protein
MGAIRNTIDKARRHRRRAQVTPGETRNRAKQPGALAHTRGRLGVWL